MNNEEAKIHLQSAKLMLLGADGQPVSDLYYAVEKGIKALEQGDVLREIRQEIAGFRDDAEIRYGHQLGFDKIYAYERCINLIDGKIKELSE